MVSSGAVDGIASDVSQTFSNLKGYISDLQGAWKGTSYEGLLSKVEEFTGEFEGAISGQIQSFQEAVDAYSQYKTAKYNYQVSESNYNKAVSAEDGENVSRFASLIQKYKADMDKLKTQINAALQNASTPKLEASSISGAKGEFVNFYQTDYGNVAYGSYGTIKSHGCGPTSLAMVLTYLLGEEIDPIQATQEAEAGGYTSSAGTYHSYFGAMAEKYGVECTQIDGVSTSQITDSLNDGKTLVMLMGPGHFTSSGHFIVVRGLDDDGKAIIADPNSREKTNQTWDLSILANESNRMWAYDN